VCFPENVGKQNDFDAIGLKKLENNILFQFFDHILIKKYENTMFFQLSFRKCLKTQ